MVIDRSHGSSAGSGASLIDMLRFLALQPRSSRTIALVLLSLLTLPLVAAEPHRASSVARPGRGSFPGRQVTTVRFFAMNLDNPIHEPRCPVPIGPDGKLCDAVVTPGVTLSTAQAEEALQLTRTRTTYSKEYTKCFLPHHALVFFDAGDHPVGFVSICFMCRQAAISPALAIAKPYDGYYAFSAAGMEHLQALCRAVGLPYCDAKVPADFTSPGKTR